MVFQDSAGKISSALAEDGGGWFLERLDAHRWIFRLFRSVELVFQKTNQGIGKQTASYAVRSQNGSCSLTASLYGPRSSRVTIGSTDLVNLHNFFTMCRFSGNMMHLA